MVHANFRRTLKCILIKTCFRGGLLLHQCTIAFYVLHSYLCSSHRSFPKGSNEKNLPIWGAGPGLLWPPCTLYPLLGTPTAFWGPSVCSRRPQLWAEETLPICVRGGQIAQTGRALLFPGHSDWSSMRLCQDFWPTGHKPGNKAGVAAATLHCNSKVSMDEPKGRK